MTEVEDVLTQAAQWRAAGEQVALATVTETWGSSPRPAGSQMVVTKSGKMAGSVSGGCIEGAVADAAMQTIATGAPQLARFRRHQRARLGSGPRLRRQGQSFRGETRMSAFGRVHLSRLLERSVRAANRVRAGMTPDLLAALTAAKEAKRPIVIATRLPDGAQTLLPDPAQPPDLNQAAETRAAR